MGKARREEMNELSYWWEARLGKGGVRGEKQVRECVCGSIFLFSFAWRVIVHFIRFLAARSLILPSSPHNSPMIFYSSYPILIPHHLPVFLLR